jgi:hypothetical protein
MILLWFGMQGEDIIEHTNGQCHVFAFWYARAHSIIEHTQAKILVSAFECQSVMG